MMSALVFHAICVPDFLWFAANGTEVGYLAGGLPLYNFVEYRSPGFQPDMEN